MFHLQNIDDGLWYEVSLVGIGPEMTIVWGSEGVPTPPPYQPAEGDPLISVEEYKAVLGIAELDVPLDQWLRAALTVSDAVESYCATSWRVPTSNPLLLTSDEAYGVEALKTTPNGLRTIVAMIIREMLGRLGASSAGGMVSMTPGMKSETLRNYSYTREGAESGVDITSVVSAYSGLLRPYRQLYVGA